MGCWGSTLESGEHSPGSLWTRRPLLTRDGPRALSAGERVIRLPGCTLRTILWTECPGSASNVRPVRLLHSSAQSLQRVTARRGFSTEMKRQPLSDDRMSALDASLFDASSESDVASDSLAVAPAEGKYVYCIIR